MSYDHNLFISQGSDWSSNVTHYTSNTSGRFVVDMSMFANGAAQLRKCMSSNAAANVAVNVHTSNSDGIVTLELTNQQTSGIEAGRYFYDVEAITPDGKITQIVRGTVTVHPSVTRTWDWGS